MKSQLVPITLILLLVVSGKSFETYDTIKNEKQMEQGPIKVSKQWADNDTILFPGETHFANIRQLTFGGDNAEAYFSFDGKWLIFQKTPNEGIACEQVWMGKI